MKKKAELVWKETVFNAIQELRDLKAAVRALEVRFSAANDLFNHILLRIEAIEDHLNINQPE